ncbi:MFS transporter [Glutamicibacter sp. NPDC055491]|uniref:MFS transporter n=1 Tax=Arthrobacter sp. MYb214 TaxID=1848596 RepID=UPI000CFAF876|nr:aromatic acid/H+ symport family MFS transporter [Arthrobacter sp. MYb214]PRB75246.1 MFS transporter [Arthrobacter sp. MYb214]
MTSSNAANGAVRWVVVIAAIALIFDGYDLVVFGTIVSTLLADPSQLGQLDEAAAGLLGSYALLGVMVGALSTGAIGDYIGRRKAMITGIIWFSVGMGLTALASDTLWFGILRFLTGMGVGAIVATAGAVVAEFAPKNSRNYYNAIVYSGVPAGGVLASLLAMVLSDVIGWRGLFLIGALPLLFLLPMAWFKLPESPQWLLSRGRVAEAREVAARTGMLLELPSDADAGQLKAERVGFAALATRRYALPTALLGMMSFAGLLLTYGLNTWMPEIMQQAGYGKSHSLLFLLVLNLAAVFGGLLASVAADRVGPKQVVALTFFLAALAMVLLTLKLPLGLLLSLVAVAGVGTIGTQVLIYGFVSNYYHSAARGAGVAWCAGFGRLGGIFGPLLGGVLLSAGVSPGTAFYVFAAVAIVGTLVTTCVPMTRSAAQRSAQEELAAAGAGK